MVHKFTRKLWFTKEDIYIYRVRFKCELNFYCETWEPLKLRHIIIFTLNIMHYLEWISISADSERIYMIAPKLYLLWIMHDIQSEYATWHDFSGPHVYNEKWVFFELFFSLSLSLYIYIYMKEWAKSQKYP